MYIGRLMRVAGALLLLLVCVVTLLLFAPAGAASRILELSGADARLLRPSGRIHAGSGQLLVAGEDLGRLHWRLEPTKALRGRISGHFQLQADDHQLQGKGRIGISGRLSIDEVSGRLEAAGLQNLLAPYDIQPSGDVTLDSGHLLLYRGQVLKANGDAHWSGGFVHYLLAGRGWTAEFPPLDASLRLRDGQPVLVVEDPDSGELLDVMLGVDGWAHLRLRYRFIAMAGFPWPDAPPADTVLIELSEQLF